MSNEELRAKYNAETMRTRGRPPVGPRIDIRLTPDVLAVLDAEAAELDVSRAELVRSIIDARYAYVIATHKPV